MFPFGSSGDEAQRCVVETLFSILQNTEPGFGVGPDTGEWVVVHTGIILIDPADRGFEAHEKLFALYNRGSGQEAADFPESLRSLSVGDIVVLGEVAYECTYSGWSGDLPAGFAHGWAEIPRT